MKTRSVVGLAGYIDAIEAAKKAGKDPSGVAAEMMVAKAVAGTPRVKQSDPANRIMQILISDGSVDRDRDTIDPRGWETANFEANPVVLWAHNYSMLPIGRDTGLEKQQMFLAGHPQFHEETELARSTYNLLVGGYLNTASVGFLPLEWLWNEERRGYDMKRQELIEYSIVPVPSNPNALVQARSAGIDLSPIKAWAEEAIDALGYQMFERSQLEAAYLIAAGEKTISIPRCFVGGNDSVIVDAARIEIAGPDGGAVKAFVVEAPAAAKQAGPTAPTTPDPAPQPSAVDKALEQIASQMQAIGTRLDALEARGAHAKHDADEGTDGGDITEDDVKGLAALLRGFRDEAIAEIDNVFARATGKVN